MPSNWTSVHPSLPRRWIDLLEEMGRRKTRDFTGKLLSGHRHWLTLDNAWEFVAGAALLPVSAVYLVVGHVGLAKLFFASPKCNGCGLCAKHCPVGAIRMRGKRNPRPFWTYACESCMRCMAFCPRKAVEASQSFAVALFYLMFLPSSSWGLTQLAQLAPGFDLAGNEWLQLALVWVWCYPAAIGSYWIFHLLTRIPGVDQVIAHTTLTFLYKRYREPGTKISDFKK